MAGTRAANGRNPSGPFVRREYRFQMHGFELSEGYLAAGPMLHQPVVIRAIQFHDFHEWCSGGKSEDRSRKNYDK